MLRLSRNWDLGSNSSMSSDYGFPVSSASLASASRCCGKRVTPEGITLTWTGQKKRGGSLSLLVAYLAVASDKPTEQPGRGTALPLAISSSTHTDLGVYDG